MLLVSVGLSICRNYKLIYMYLHPARKLFGVFVRNFPSLMKFIEILKNQAKPCIFFQTFSFLKKKTVTECYFADIFLICLNEIFYISKVLFLIYIYMLYYLTNLIIWNNIFENVSTRPYGSILKP